MTNKLKDFFKELISFVFSAPKDDESAQTLPKNKAEECKKVNKNNDQRYIPATAKNVEKYLGGVSTDVAMVFPERLEKALDILEEGGKSSEETLKAFAILMNLDNDKYMNSKSGIFPSSSFAGFPIRMLYMK